MPMRRDQYISACAQEIKRAHGAEAVHFVQQHLLGITSDGDEATYEMWQAIAAAVVRSTAHRMEAAAPLIGAINQSR